MRLALIGAAALLLCACTQEPTPESVAIAEAAAAPKPPEAFEVLRRDQFDNNIELVVMRDLATKCDWIVLNSYRSGGMQARTRPSGHVCDGSVKTSGFKLVSSDDIGPSTGVMVFRDIDTGCDWIWYAGYHSGALMPRTHGREQICTRYS